MKSRQLTKNDGVITLVLLRAGYNARICEIKSQLMTGCGGSMSISLTKVFAPQRLYSFFRE